MSIVRQLHDGAPSLMDIPGRLRQLANAYEDSPEDIPHTFLWVEYNEDGSIDLGCFGISPTNKAQVVGILALAQRHFDHETGDLYRGDHSVGDKAPVFQLRGTTMKMKDDPTEGGVPPSNTTPYSPAPEKKASKAWIGYAVGALIVAALIFMATR